MKTFLFILPLFLINLANAQWEVQNSSTLQSLNSVQFINENTGWAAGDRGVIIHTTNGGEDWDFQESNYIENLKKVFFVDSMKGWISGMDSTLLKTLNGGVDWEIINVLANVDPSD